MKLTFHEDSTVFLSGKLSASWEVLEVNVDKLDTPLGPSYDLECAALKGGEKVQATKGSMNVHVKHIKRTVVSAGSFDSIYAETDVAGILYLIGRF